MRSFFLNENILNAWDLFGLNFFFDFRTRDIESSSNLQVGIQGFVCIRSIVDSIVPKILKNVLKKDAKFWVCQSLIKGKHGKFTIFESMDHEHSESEDLYFDMWLLPFFMV